MALSGPLHRVLVTGASGFIGGRLVRRLVEGGGWERVVCLVRGGSGGKELRAAGAEVVVGDVTDRSGVARAVEESRAGVVFHVAGLVRARGVAEFMRVNAGGVETVAAACAARAEPPVLVVVSSLAAAGPCGVGRVCVESDVAAPVSEYGRSKLAGEEAAARYAGAVPISVVRPPIVFGPGGRSVLEMFRPIARWGLHVVPGLGERRYSLVHVDDLVEGLLLVAERGERMARPGTERGRGIYFVGGEDPPTYAELGREMAAALGRKPPTVVRVPGPVLRVLGALGDVRAQVSRRGGPPGSVGRDKVREALAGSWVCSSAKARAELGWSESATLGERLRETVQWYRGAGWL